MSNTPEIFNWNKLFVYSLWALILLNLYYINFGLSFYDNFMTWMVGDDDNVTSSFNFYAILILFSSGMFISATKPSIRTSFFVTTSFLVLAIILGLTIESTLAGTLVLTAIILFIMALINYLINVISISEHGRTCNFVWISALDEATGLDMIYTGLVIFVVICWIIA